MLTVTHFADIASNLDDKLTGLRDNLQTGVAAIHAGTFGTLPMVDNLGDRVETEFNLLIGPIKDAIGNLDDVANNPDTAIQNALFNALGPSHLGILVDRATNSTDTGVSASDVQVTNLNGVQFEVDARLYVPIAAAATPTNFDLGLPGLPFELTSAGKLSTSIGMAYELAFQFDTGASTVSLDSSKTLAGFTPPVSNFPTTNLNHPLAFFVSTTPTADFSARARLGFVEGDLTPTAGLANGLALTVTADALDPGLSSQPTLAVDGQANINMTLHGSFATSGADDFPGIDTDLHFAWKFDSAHPDLNPPTVSFDNVALDLGHFISDMLKPVLTDIQQATLPLEPVLKILDTPIPGLTDLAQLLGQGDVTLLTLAGAVAPYTGYGPLFDLAEKATDLLNIIDSIQIDSTIKLPLGGFNLDGTDLRDAQPALDISDLAASDLTSLTIDPNNIQKLADDFQSEIAKLNLPPDVTSMFSQITAGLNNGFSIDFPFLDDPSSAVFNMLLGRDSDLAVLTADAHVSAQGNLGPTGMSIFNQEVDYGGKVNVDLHFKMAYDTHGVRELINQIAAGGPVDVLSDITDGFYISNDSYFKMSGDINAHAGQSFGVYEAAVAGDVSTGGNGTIPVSITIDNPAADGKKRLGDVPLFDLSGNFEANLGVQVGIGQEILGHFIGVQKTFDIANEVLVRFDAPDDTVLASQPDVNGNVVLYLGENASLRKAKAWIRSTATRTFQSAISAPRPPVKRSRSPPLDSRK